MDIRFAYVYVNQSLAGIIRETDEGYQFQYDNDYLLSEHSTAVSLTLPLREESYTSKYLFPFFDGLIPEGWLLDVVTNNWKLDPSDRFGILIAACKDCIGNVSIRRDKL